MFIAILIVNILGAEALIEKYILRDEYHFKRQETVSFAPKSSLPKVLKWREQNLVVVNVQAREKENCLKYMMREKNMTDQHCKTIIATDQKLSMKVENQTRICLWCKQCFTQNAQSRRRQLYCSQQCRVYTKRQRQNPNYKPTPIINYNPQCLRCKKHFIPHPKAAGRHKHCSIKCSVAIGGEKRKKERMLLLQGKKQPCAYCSQDFELTRRDRKTCSELCSKELAKKRAYEYAIANTIRIADRVQKECVWCGEDYIAALVTSKHCSMICRKEDSAYSREEEEYTTDTKD